MLVQDGLGYVGFAAARGMNVTYSNIVFTTSAWDAAGWHPQEPEQVAADYQITSPSTAAENSYTLVFKANADGVANVYQNGALVDSVSPPTPSSPRRTPSQGTPPSGWSLPPTPATRSRPSRF